MRRPLVIVAILYVCGLLLAERLTVPLPWLLGSGILLASLATAWKQGRPWVLPGVVVLAGWANLASHTHILSPHDLRLTLGSEPEDILVRGTLRDTPSVRMFIRDEEESFRTLATLEVSEIRRHGQWLPVYGQMISLTPGDLSALAHAGSRVEIRGIAALPPEALAPGMFDYRAYLRRQGIWFQLSASSTNDWRVLEAAGPSLSTRFIEWAQTTLARGLPVMDEPLRLLYSMTLGWKTGLTNEVYEPFMQSGTMHIFAISGLHIALIAGILVALLRGLRLSRQWCGLVVIPLIWFYTGATGWQSSAIRSTLMMTLIVGGWSLHRPTDLLNSLAAAGLMILVWEPQQLFQASFQLSFFVVLSIALLTPPLRRYADKLLAHDPLLPREALPRWRRWLETPARWFALSFSTSLAAWLGSLPLTMHYFHLFSPITLLANLIIVPLSSAALASALASLLCGAWLPGISAIFNHGSWLWMTSMVRLSQIASELPGAYCYAASPRAVDFIIYYGLLVLVLSRVLFQPGRRRWLALTLMAVAAVYGWRWQESRQETHLTVLPLNGGHAVFVDSPGRGDDWLIDCGNPKAAQFATVPFLRAQGVNVLAGLALTHGDLQHVGGAEFFWDEVPTVQTFTSPVRFRSATYRSIISALEAAPERHELLARGEVRDRWTTLHPDGEDSFPQADDASLVLLGNFHGSEILLVGDLGRPGQEALMKNNTNLQADIVITGLPERGEALCDGLIEQIQPQLIIVADSEFPATKRAQPELLDRLARQGVRVLSTRRHGAVTLHVKPGTWTALPAQAANLKSAKNNSVNGAERRAERSQDPVKVSAMQ